MDAAYLRGEHYLQKIQELALESNMIYALDRNPERTVILTWIGTHIDRINALLQNYGEKCTECWAVRDRPSVQIFAVPFATAFAIEGCCNFATTPITVLIDVGRVIPAHWLHVVVHEYAHAYVGQGGHRHEFTQVLTHLCLGLGLPTPGALTSEQLQSFPPCISTADSLVFWQGK